MITFKEGDKFKAEDGTEFILSSRETDLMNYVRQDFMDVVKGTWDFYQSEQYNEHCSWKGIILEEINKQFAKCTKGEQDG